MSAPVYFLTLGLRLAAVQRVLEEVEQR